ncbi:MAG: hypothetical protein COA78_01720 [Blastopirellula sp.]|nr:MAG: hypothetical protein COA78_01720 [Blastopirellula sp.]
MPLAPPVQNPSEAQKQLFVEHESSIIKKQKLSLSLLIWVHVFRELIYTNRLFALHTGEASGTQKLCPQYKLRASNAGS